MCHTTSTTSAPAVRLFIVGVSHVTLRCVFRNVTFFLYIFLFGVDKALITAPFSSRDGV